MTEGWRRFDGRTCMVVAVAIVGCCGWSWSATLTVTTTADGGPGSLRQAITDANGTADDDRIEFAIPSGQCEATGICVISLASSLPVVTESLIIDGTTQPRSGSAPANVCATPTSPSYMRVQLESLSGYILAFVTLDTTRSFEVRGIAFSGASTTQAILQHTYSETKVQCNHFGTDGSGTVILDLEVGVCVSCQAGGGNLIAGVDGDGFDDVGERNVFAGGVQGVNVNSGDGASPNTIAGNFFGVGADGVSEMDLSLGVYLRQLTAGTIIGTNGDGLSDDLERNVFVWCHTGVFLDMNPGVAPGNMVTGNWFGVDIGGRPAPNYTGLYVARDSASQVIWGNLFAGNVTGISVSANATLSSVSGSNCIVGNSTGFRHSGTALNLDAEVNYWGRSDGPSGAGFGSGDAITILGTGTVDWTPWLATPIDACTLVFYDGFESGLVNAWSSSIGDR